MKTLTRTATEGSAITAFTVFVTLFASGHYVPAGVSLAIGFALLFAYEYFGVEGISINEEQIEDVSHGTADEIEDVAEDVDLGKGN